MSLANKVSPKIQKVINRFPTIAKVYRLIPDKYGEDLEKVFICDLRGFYHESSNNTSISISLEDKGEISRGNPVPYLMVLIDEKSNLIQKEDILYINGVEEYTLRRINNPNKLNIYYDLLLEPKEV